MKIDLSQFRQTFMQESAEHVESMETGLLDLRTSPEDIELLNSIFRSAHSIKGGAGSFGLTHLVRFTHALENLLDRLRSLEMPATPEVINLLLQSVDVLGVLLDQGGEEAGADGGLPPAAALVVDEIERLVVGGKSVGGKSVGGKNVGGKNVGGKNVGQKNEGPEDEGQTLAGPLGGEPVAASAGKQAAKNDQNDQGIGPAPAARYRVVFRPDAAMFASGNDPLVLVRNLSGLGTVGVCELDTERLPALDELDVERCYLDWKIELETARPEAELREVFEFVEHLAEIEIEQIDEIEQQDMPAAQELGLALRPVPVPATNSVSDSEPGLVSGLVPGPVPGLVPGLVLTSAQAAQRTTGHGAGPTAVARFSSDGAASGELVPGAPVMGGAAGRRKSADRRKEESSSIRVATDKVDRLIDLVGELVIAHVMTAQMVEGFVPECLPKLREAVSAMERGTRELHERVMAVRMLPVGTLFQRYARVVYDIAQATGKRISLETAGEETEIDKSMLELLGDPLTHIIRNSADHGIESPIDRAAAGKPEEGVIHLRAFHRSGRVVIEIADDGAGIDTARVRAKAVERGLISADAQLSEEQLRMLIFEPGFSTRDKVSDLSGRGVGMDVVKRNVQQLNGVVKLESEQGRGSTVSIELPLTLAILEGLLVQVAEQTLVLPLLAVIETVSPKPGQIVRVAEQGEVVVVRGESIPLLRLRRFLGRVVGESVAAERSPEHSGEHSPERSLVVVVEADGKKFGLIVDELLGQQQVVVKSLEKHFRKVDGLMGATILGDGCVAPIVDVAGLAELDLFRLPALDLACAALSAGQVGLSSTAIHLT